MLPVSAFIEAELDGDMIVDVLAYVGQQAGVSYRTVQLPNGTVRHYVVYDQEGASDAIHEETPGAHGD